MSTTMIGAIKRIGVLVVATLFAASGWAQSKRELVELGDQAFEKANYASAVYFYLKIVEGGSGGKLDVHYPYEINTFVSPVKQDSSNVFAEHALTPAQLRQLHVIHKLADAYRLLHDYENAAEWYQKAAEAPSEEFPYTRYWYGSSLMKVEQYDKANAQFDKFMEENGNENDPFYKLAQDKEVSCSYALNPENQNTKVIVSKMDSIFNSGSSSFAATFYEGELSVMFSSGRSTSTVADIKKQDPHHYADIFITQNIGNGWEPAVKIHEPISSPMHEGAGALSIDRTTFYFTRWSDEDKTDCHIYVAKKFNGQWMQPLKLNTVNVDGYRSMQPHLSLDEETLYFVSDMPGGQGGLDIWGVHIDPETANLGNPYPLGPAVNTPEDEMSPFHHFQTNTLYFSSEGHVGFGGMDVFRTKYDDDAQSWGTPVNMGAPINSSKDDTYYILDHNQKFGFLTSDRDKCDDCDSASIVTPHCDKIYKVERPELEFSISGFVFNGETDEIIPNALITFKDIKGNWAPFFVFTNEEGYYEKELEPNMDMFMKAQKTNFFGDAATASTSGLTESTHLEQDFILNPIPQDNEGIEIPGIEYDFDKATLRPKSKEILDDLYDFLQVNDNLVVEIQSHTDFRGDDAYNLDLSDRRAKSVVDYLVDKGIPRERLVAKGYGETTPAVKKDENGKPIRGADGEYERLTEPYIRSLTDQHEIKEAHQRNRRTAFVVLSQDHKEVLKSN